MATRRRDVSDEGGGDKEDLGASGAGCPAGDSGEENDRAGVGEPGFASGHDSFDMKVSDHVVLALSQEHIRMLSVLSRVPKDDSGSLDLRAWARMVDLPQRRVCELSRGLMDMGAFLPDGTMPSIVDSYLSRLAKGCLSKA